MGQSATARNYAIGPLERKLFLTIVAGLVPPPKPHSGLPFTAHD